VISHRDRNGLHDLSTLLNVGTAVGRTDGQLLECFATRAGDASELAFATLVDRHGPMVLRTCRAILRDEPPGRRPGRRSIRSATACTRSRSP
jgi:hypothetical protein